MFCELMIKAMPKIVKFTQELNLAHHFSKPQIKHMQAFIIAMLMKGFCGKISHISDRTHHADRTCVGRFLDSAGWDDSLLIKSLNDYAIKSIWEHSKHIGLPIYIIIDDTICEKTKPSSKAKRPIEGAGIHKSHLKNEFVYGHQFVYAVLRCGEKVLPLSLSLYEKGVKSKIDIAKDIILSLPKPVNRGYVLTDSWYACTDLFEAAHTSGYHFVGALKSNRKIFPRSCRLKGIQIGAFARSLRVSDFDYVTVDGKRYFMYTYLGKINGLKKVKIVITYPVNALFNPRAMKAFISTDVKMNGLQLLLHYTKRWPIEVFFRETNRHFGMKHCQVRSKKAIIRYQYFIIAAYIFCGLNVIDSTLTIGDVRKSFQNDFEHFRVAWIVEQTLNGVSLETIYSLLDIV